MKTFKIEFLCFPGLEVQCKLCEGFIKDRQEEVIIPVIYHDEHYRGPICEKCYRALPERVNNSLLPKFNG